MYEAHFGLSGPPFQLNPDPAFYFDSRGHSRALAYLKFGAHQGEGFIVVTGEIGAGKTTLVRTLLEGLDPSQVVAAQIVSTQLESSDLLRAILVAFGVPVAHESKAHLIGSLEAFLMGLAVSGRRALLIIDEAQNLSREAIEELRMLSNFQLESHALLQSFLVGQPELRALLRSREMEQLRQRVAASCHLGALDRAETRAYIEHRLRRVGWAGRPRFSDESHEHIHRWTDGVPRRINRLCNRLLLAAYLHDNDEISALLVDAVGGELRQEVGEMEHIPEVPHAAPASGTAPDASSATHERHRRIGASARTGAILGVVDCRTDFFKLVTLAQVLAESADGRSMVIVHTGTEEDVGAGTLFDGVLAPAFEEIHLGLSGADAATTFAALSIRFDALLASYSPSAVLSVGVSDASLVCGLLAAKRDLPVFRIDAGVRFGDGRRACDLNAVLLDRLADMLFTARLGSRHNLMREGVTADRVQCVGSFTTALIRRLRPESNSRDGVLSELGLDARRLSQGYALFSLRLGQGDNADATLSRWLPVLRVLGDKLPLVWPLAQDDMAAIARSGLAQTLDRMAVMPVADPGYLETLQLLHFARCLVTGPEHDLLEEAVGAGRPSLTIGAALSAATVSGEVPCVSTGCDPQEALTGLCGLIDPPLVVVEPPDFWISAVSRVAQQLRRMVRSAPQVRPHAVHEGLR